MAKNKMNVNEFNNLFAEYNSYVFKIVINETNNKLTREDIEETVSDIFFLLWKNASKIKDPQKIKAYLGKVAKNTAKNKLRNLKKEINYEDNLFSNSRGEDHSYHINEQLRVVREALQNVDILDKRIFMMFYYENKKVKEIAKLENMNNSTVKTRLHRTRKKLKKILEKRGFKNG